VSWDGTTTGGSIADGSFTAKVELVYLKGNVASSETAPFICSGKAPALGVTLATGGKPCTENNAFSPDNDGTNDELNIGLSAKSVLPFKSWSFRVLDPKNRKPFWTVTGGDSIADSLTWDGKSNAFAGAELVQSAMDYPYEFTVTDSQGLSSNTTGTIPVDILVVRDGNALRIRVAAIIFRANKADFEGRNKDPRSGLTQEQIDKNTSILKRVARILSKYSSYTVTVNGYANPLTPPGSKAREKEETEGYNGSPASRPLSLDRAKFVVEQLVKDGVSRSRLSAAGLGGANTVAPWNDKDNNWKNRRVEFILNKKN
jgi:hypothetical protein